MSINFPEECAYNKTDNTWLTSLFSGSTANGPCWHSAGFAPLSAISKYASLPGYPVNTPITLWPFEYVYVSEFAKALVRIRSIRGRYLLNTLYNLLDY